MTTALDYREVMNAYGDAIARAVGDRYVALTAKWQPEDLIAGLSDLDFRVILKPDAGVEEWIAVDQACFRIHKQLTLQSPRYWRILEHLPGCGLTTDNMTDGLWYHPEFRAWQLCHGDPKAMDRWEAQIQTRPWDDFDEAVHLKKYLSYFAPYQQGIDPPINLGDYVHLYDMHSRCWHYFMPPMFSVAALLSGNSFRGKREALHWLIEQFPGCDAFGIVLKTVDSVYNVPETTDRGLRDKFEQSLYQVFHKMLGPVRDSLRYHSWSGAEDDIAGMKKSLSAGESRQTMISAVIDAVRFARIRLGRYLFYLDPPEGFMVDFLLCNEANWARIIIEAPLRAGMKLLRIDPQKTAPEAFMVEVLGRSLSSTEQIALGKACHLAGLRFQNYQEARVAFLEANDHFYAYYHLLEEYLPRLLAAMKHQEK